MGCYGTPLPWCFGALLYMLVQHNTIGCISTRWGVSEHLEKVQQGVIE